MKNPMIKIVAVALLVSPQCLLAQQASDEAVKKYVLQVAKACCSNAYEIIQQEEASSVAFYMENETKQLSLTNFETTVHESLHGYDHAIGWKRTLKEPGSEQYDGYFIDKDIQLSVQRLPVFHTADLDASYFPVEVKRLFRYDTYIFGNENPGGKEGSDGSMLRKGEASVTANVFGIYGLLEEFNAYYHGVRAELELMKSGQKYTYFGDSHLMTASYYEFNIFMAYYLKYAKEKKPEVYEKLMKQKELRTIYTLIETNWRDLLTDIYSDPAMAMKFPGSEGESRLFTPELRKVMSGFMLPSSSLPEYAAFFKSRAYNPDLIAAKRIDDYHAELFGGDDDDSDGLFDFVGNIDMPLQLNGKQVADKEQGWYYVVAEAKDQVKDALESYMGYAMKFPDAHMYRSDGKLFIYVAKFTSKSKAEEWQRANKARYPDFCVM